MRRDRIATLVVLAAAMCEPLFGAGVSWTQGTSGPAAWTINPANPVTSDTISFTGPLNGMVYSNSCVAEASLGGTPQISTDTANRVIELWFQGPAPTTCTMIYLPVCGLQGNFGPLAAGKWTFRCTPLGVNLTFSVSATGAVIYVDRNSPGPIRDGTTWARAFLYLQDALAVWGTGNEIRVADGTYTPDKGAGLTAGDRMASFNVSNGVVIRGGYAGYGAVNPNARDIATYATILSGDLNGDDLWGTVNRDDNSYHVVTVSGDAKLDGLSIRNGQADGPYPHFYGGGIYALGGHLILSRCTIKENTALYGGGMAAITAWTYLGNCNLSGNRAYLFGGGIYNDDGDTSLATCLMTGNSAGTSGLGGGSAITNIGGPDANMVIGNCTIADNIGSYPDDIAVLNFSLGAAPTPPTAAIAINNSIIYDTGGSSLIWTNDASRVSASYSLIQGNWSGTGNLDTDPRFIQRGVWNIEDEWIDAASNYGLQSTSPVIDAGKTSLLPADVADVDGDGNTTETHPTDLAGQNRVQGTQVDMGAYESAVSGSGYAWEPIATWHFGVYVPYGLTGPVTVDSGLLTETVTTTFKAELMLDIKGTSIADGTWMVWFDPDPGAVGPGIVSVSLHFLGVNVAANLLTAGTTPEVAQVTVYARPAP